MQPPVRPAAVSTREPRCHVVALVTRRHIDLQRVAAALCPR
ncbi:putative leader peptide [Micromonospora sp. NPDC050417]